MQALAAKYHYLITRVCFPLRSAPASTAAAEPPFLLRHIRVLGVMEMVFKQRQFRKSFPNA